jgi:hypothetical protein
MRQRHGMRQFQMGLAVALWQHGRQWLAASRIYFLFGRRGCRRRSPGLPPFPSINSTPAAVIDLALSVSSKSGQPLALNSKSPNTLDTCTNDYFCFLGLCGFRKRTPSPPSLSSMNSIPAVSNARRMAASFASVTGISPSMTSALRIVATPTFDARAKSRAVHRISARAART